MNTSSSCSTVRSCLALAAFLSVSLLANAQTLPNWEAFNDHAPGATTDPNATGYDLQITGGPSLLKNIATGEDLSVSLIVTLLGTSPGFGANSPVNAGSPADRFFGTKVTIGNDGIPGVDGTPADTVKVTLAFTGLDLTKRYKLRGTVSRGGNYNDRWTVFTLTNVTSFLAAHEDGSPNRNIITKTTFPAAALETNQVALNTGDNKAGSLVGWDNIEPTVFMLEDGTEVTGFSIVEEQYVGAAPFGTPANGPYAYGFGAFYLAEFESTGALRITENPASQKVPAGRTATLRVMATSSGPITYQWQKAPPGTNVFTNISGATNSTYTTPVLTAADDGSMYRSVISSLALQATSGEATLTVDAIIPTIAAVRGSINSNSVYVTFSEPMKLEQLGDAANYRLNGGLTIDSAVVLDSTNARLRTSLQAPATKYTVTATNIEDLAGNPVAANSTTEFTSFSLVSGAVGIEIWDNIPGGAVNDLRTNLRYPLEYDVDYSATTFDSTLVRPDFPFNTYGGRIRAYLVPQEAAEYEFFIRADDSGELRLSLTDPTFDTIDDDTITTPIATVTGGGPFQETGSAATSTPILLEAGTRYPIQFIWKEANINDYGQVAWRKVGDPTLAADLQPIPSQFLMYNGLSTGTAPTNLLRLSIARLSNNVVLSWPAPSAGFVLEETSQITQPAASIVWTPVTTPVVVVGGSNTVTLPINTARRFFRLRL